MSERLEKARDVVRAIKQDCATDAQEVDRTPFSPRGIGETFGTQLALIAGLAAVAEVLVDEIAALRRERAGEAR